MCREHLQIKTNNYENAAPRLQWTVGGSHCMTSKIGVSLTTVITEGFQRPQRRSPSRDLRCVLFGGWCWWVLMSLDANGGDPNCQLHDDNDHIPYKKMEPDMLKRNKHGAILLKHHILHGLSMIRLWISEYVWTISKQISDLIVVLTEFYDRPREEFLDRTLAMEGTARVLGHMFHVLMLPSLTAIRLPDPHLWRKSYINRRIMENRGTLRCFTTKELT